MLTGLRNARIRAGLTQAQAGALIGAGQSTFAKYERGALALRAADALTLCRAFGVDLAELLKSAVD